METLQPLGSPPNAFAGLMQNINLSFSNLFSFANNEKAESKPKIAYDKYPVENNGGDSGGGITSTVSSENPHIQTPNINFSIAGASSV